MIFSSILWKANAIISYNNKPANQAVPYIEQVMLFVYGINYLVDLRPCIFWNNRIFRLGLYACVLKIFTQVEVKTVEFLAFHMRNKKRKEKKKVKKEK